MNKAQKVLSKLRSINEGYIAISFDADTRQRLSEICDLIGETSIMEEISFVDSNEFHTTLMYSPTTPVLDIIPELVGKTIVAHNPRFQLFGPENDVLVIQFESPELDILNQKYKDMGEIPSELSAEYKPHITLAKDVVGLEMPTLPALPLNIPLVITDHYAEEIK
jgi:2'-5' RNA ligase